MSANKIVASQALDEGLWFAARTAPEAYLQAALRELHAAIEAVQVEPSKSNKPAVAALKAGRRAIGDHFAPDDCYATGPMTGDPIRDLVQCPACSFIELYDIAISALEAVQVDKLAKKAKQRNRGKR